MNTEEYIDSDDGYIAATPLRDDLGERQIAGKNSMLVDVRK